MLTMAKSRTLEVKESTARMVLSFLFGLLETAWPLAIDLDVDFSMQL